MNSKLIPIKFLIIITLLSFGLAGCTTEPPRTSSTLTIQPKIVKLPTPEEKETMLSRLNVAIQKEKYEDFANALKEIYEKGWLSVAEFAQAESKLYAKGGEYLQEGLNDQVFKMASAIYPKVYESWRFKYLKIRALENYGNDAFEKGDLVKAEDYAKQITSIEFRPEGVNLQAKIYIKQAEDAVKEGNKEKAKGILMQTADIDISEELRKKIDDILKTL